MYIYYGMVCICTMVLTVFYLFVWPTFVLKSLIMEFLSCIVQDVTDALGQTGQIEIFQLLCHRVASQTDTRDRLFVLFITLILWSETVNSDVFRVPGPYN